MIDFTSDDAADLALMVAMVDNLARQTDDDMRDYEQGLCVICGTSRRFGHSDWCAWKIARQVYASIQRRHPEWLRHVPSIHPEN